jgi:mRNA interferase RelE/StbE
LSSSWSVVWSKSVEKKYKKYPEKERFQKIILRLKQNPSEGPNIKPLVGELQGLYRYRFSNMRLIYQIDQKAKLITLVYFGSRGDIYG